MKYGLVVDLGATNIRVALVNEKCEIVKKIKHSTDKNADIAASIYNIYVNEIGEYDLYKMVVAVPGTIDYEKHIIRDLPNMNIKEYDLYRELNKYFNTDITIINDASLACLGEYSRHNEEKVFEYITISSGIGGGLIYNGKLFNGSNGFEQEIGRMYIEGTKFENLCSANALKDRLEKENIKLTYPSDALISKDEKTQKIVQDWTIDLAKGISNIVKIINPSMIVFGGGIGRYIDSYKENLYTYMKQYLPIDIIDNLKIEKAYYDDDSALIGGSLLIFQDN